MDKLAQLSPLHLVIIVVMAIGVVLMMGLWDWRTVLIARICDNRSSAAYGKQQTTADQMATVTGAVAATDNEPRNVIAISRNDGNVVLRARAELIARLLKSKSLYINQGGKYKNITQTGLIELATGLKPNGRAESDYGQLHAELEPLIHPVLHIAAGQPHEQVIPK